MTHTHTLPPPVLPASAKPQAPPPDTSNPEAALARSFVLETDRHVFLTGRAGTGKTTFLRELRSGGLARKRHVVVAPTGVAAINAGGATIHSTFGLPFGTLTSERLRPGKGRRGLSKRKERVLRAIDLLVVDEVSMVRADVLDAIDYVLRRVRRSPRPFGGVQLLLIGDLHQLPPVVTRDEEAEMAARYATPYFFGAACLRDADLVTVELRRVYRQSDGDFVELLGEVRAGRLTPRVLAALNARHVHPGAPAFPGPGDGYITLTSHRSTAREINRHRLGEVAGASTRFDAMVSGDFPESAYPTDQTLELKVGAQVMFVKNDPDGSAFYNGKIGVVTALTDDRVTVDCEGDDEAVEIGRLSWENTKYSLAEGSKEVAEEVAGRFAQIPLRLAWAITIHKSQGLTFDRVVIDAAAAFAHGQVYVALSRCRSLGGIVLRTPLDAGCAPSDAQVTGYSETARRDPPDVDVLQRARRAYRRELLTRAFDLDALTRASSAMLKFYLRNEPSYATRQGEAFEAAVQRARREVFAVARAFAAPLADLLDGADFDRDAIAVPERARRGARYLREKLQADLGAFIGTLDLVSDNQQVSKRTADLAQELGRALRVALAGLTLAERASFTPAEFERARTDAGLDQATAQRRAASSRAGADLPAPTHPELLAALKAWRTERASADELHAYRIMSTRSLREIAERLPASSDALGRVHGIGAKKLAAYGADLVGLVAKYCEGRGIDPAEAAADGARQLGLSAGPSVNASVALTLSMFGRGLNPADIAAERELKEDTIRGHLARGVEAGRIELPEVVEPELLDRLATYFESEGADADVKSAYRHFEGRVDYATLRLTRKLTTE